GRELSAASVAALVSVEENAPLAVQEAMAVGVPVVTSNRCGMPYQVADGETGFLVDPLDGQDVAVRLEQLLPGRALRQALGARAETVAQHWFHRGVVARRTREVYERASAAPTRRRPTPRSSAGPHAAAATGAQPPG